MTRWRPLPKRGAEARPPHRVADSLDQVARRVGVPKASSLTAVFARWSDIVGASVADHCRPHSLRDGVLQVVVSEPAWATQLSFLSSRIIERCDEVAGPGSVTSVVVRVGRPGSAPESAPKSGRE